MIELMHGDYIEKMKDVEDGSIDMILSDPPYEKTMYHWDSIIPLPLMWEHLNRIIKKNGVIILIASQPFTNKLILSNKKMFKYCWTWEKTNVTGFFSAKKRPLVAHEDICVFYKKQPIYNLPKTQGCHPVHPNVKTIGTIRKVSLGEYLVNIYTNKGDTVLDFCMGSGSFGASCVDTGRNFMGIEKNDEYFSKAKNRIFNISKSND